MSRLDKARKQVALAIIERMPFNEVSRALQTWEKEIIERLGGNDEDNDVRKKITSAFFKGRNLGRRG